MAATNSHDNISKKVTDQAQGTGTENAGHPGVDDAWGEKAIKNLLAKPPGSGTTDSAAHAGRSGDSSVTQQMNSQDFNPGERGSMGSGSIRMPGDKGGAIIEFLPERKMPTQADVDSAKQKLDNLINPLVPEADRKLFSDMGKAIVSGDAKALADVVKQLKDDPAKLKKFADELQKNLSKEDATTKLVATPDGRLLVYDGTQFDSSNTRDFTAVEVGPNGAVNVRAITKDGSGNITINPGEVLNHTADAAMKTIADQAVMDMRFSGLRKLPYLPNELQPDTPHFPGGGTWKMERPNELFERKSP